MENGKRKIVSSDSAFKKQKTYLKDVYDSDKMPPDSDVLVLTENNAEDQLQTKKCDINNTGVKRTPKKIRENKTVKSRKPGFSDDCYNETSYYFENGLRKVYPYYFTFTTYTKGRWVGEKVLDVFAREFRAHSAAEYERCIKAGTLTVNREKVETDYILKHNDLLANVVHRHEVPVSAEPITIVHMDDDILVVNKPASIPVHPCGRYRHNTVVFILAKEYDLKGLRTIHRLDRLTSGLLLFGKTLQRTSTIEEQIRKREVLKEYVCRVEGEFPDGKITCEEPIEVVSYKIGVCKVSPRGKTCSTIFQKVSFNGKSSVVSCKPHTGRMHQIRVHLQYLGFPIINDPLYNHPVFGPEKGKGGNIGKSDEDLIQELMIIHNAESWLGTEGNSEFSMFRPLKEDPNDKINTDDIVGKETAKDNNGNKQMEAENRKEYPKEELISSKDSLKQDENVETSNESLNVSEIGPNDKINTDDKVGKETAKDNNGNKQMEAENRKEYPKEELISSKDSLKQDENVETSNESLNVSEIGFSAEKIIRDEHCYECKVQYRDPKPSDLVMFLHAWKYQGPDWSYQTELPDWARIDWTPENR